MLWPVLLGSGKARRQAKYPFAIIAKSVACLTGFAGASPRHGAFADRAQALALFALYIKITIDTGAL
jgi:hypothetical protein